MPVKGNVVIFGMGALGRGMIGLILKHLDVPKSRITIIDKGTLNKKVAEKYGLNYKHHTVTKTDYKKYIGDLLDKDSILLNLTNDVSSLDLVRLCYSKGALYVDSCIEPWGGYYENPNIPAEKKSNYFLRSEALELRKEIPNGPTAMFAIGANPGLVSPLAKQAMLNIAKDTGLTTDIPKNRQEWAKLAFRLGIKGIQISERDHQVCNVPKKNGVFTNTWSVDGILNEGTQPSEVGWGTHEDWLPPHGHNHKFGNKCAIYFDTPSLMNRVRGWTPLEGPYLGYLITHNEAISLSDYFTHHENNKPIYRPSSYYCYHPCNDAVLSIHESIGRGFPDDCPQKILYDEIIDGIDELGVLLYGHKKNAYWYGSQLSIHDARKRMPENNATTLQVTSTIMASILWALQNPKMGILEAEDLDYKQVIDFCKQYIDPVVGKYTDWNPYDNHSYLFKQFMDPKNTWGFKNILLQS